MEPQGDLRFRLSKLVCCQSTKEASFGQEKELICLFHNITKEAPEKAFSFAFYLHPKCQSQSQSNLVKHKEFLLLLRIATVFPWL